MDEKSIKRIVQKHPHLLVKDKNGINQKISWLYIGEEIGIPVNENGDLVYIDLLFLDQFGVPTIVEVKSSSNEEIKRHVLGQVFDYAYHASKYLTKPLLIEYFSGSCLNNNEDPSEVIRDYLENEVKVDISIDKYWEQVVINLDQGNIRLLIVVDNIPEKLWGIMKFINEQIHPVEISCIEIKDFVLNNPEEINSIKSKIETSDHDEPDYHKLYLLAEKQAGYFSAKQAKEVGFSYERLSSNVQTGKFKRIMWGIYRLVHFPGSDYEDLYVTFLRTGPDSAISHESALAFYELSDYLPNKNHVTVPRTASRRREGIQQHTNKIRDEDVVHVEGLKVTTVPRTIVDVIKNNLSEEHVKRAIYEALNRNMVSIADLSRQAKYAGGTPEKIIHKYIRQYLEE